MLSALAALEICAHAQAADGEIKRNETQRNERQTRNKIWQKHRTEHEDRDDIDAHVHMCTGSAFTAAAVSCYVRVTANA